MTMKTFADVKRRITVGCELDMIYHARPGGAVLPMRRKVMKVQANAIAMTSWSGKPGLSWLYWGKASEVRVDGPDTFSILDPDTGVVQMTYAFCQ
jgi:hypothetical protein